MNWIIIVSGILAAAVTLGHSTLGRRDYFLPMTRAEFDPYAKRVMEFVWHMATVSLILLTLALLALGFGFVEEGGQILGWFVFAHFLGWGIVHFLLGITSGLPSAISRMFQWILFLLVAATAGVGLALG